MSESTDNRRVTLRDVWHHTSRFFTRMPVALLGTWSILTAGLMVLLFWEDSAFPSAWELMSGNIGELSVTEFFILFLVIQVVMLLRMALLLPARVAYHGGDPSWRAVIRMAFDRFLPLLDLQLKIGFGFSLVSIACIVFDVTISTWVFLPLAFLLEPAHYFVTAHQMKAGQAIRKSLEVARHHWMPIFVVFGSLTCLSLALPPLIETIVGWYANGTPTTALDLASKVGRSTIHMGADFVSFLVSCGLYFALDERA
jgi:hypothetical protein